MKTALLLAAASVLSAASPTAWETTSYQDFLKAKFTGLALSRDGRVSLAPKLETIFAGESAVWSMVQAVDGTVYLGTGHKGKLMRVDRAGRASVAFTAGEAEIFAVAIDAAGRVFAATSPEGKIYRLEGGAAPATEYFDPKSRYIWSLAVGRDGALYAGTGDEGKIFRITGAAQGEVYYETGQSHVTALAWDREGRLLAGSEPNGLVYRVSAKDRAFVIHDAALPEIRSIVLAADGSIYVAAMGGSVSRQTNAGTAGAAGSQPAAPTPTITTTVTVTEDAQGGIDKPKPAAAQSAASGAPVAAPAAAALTEYAGVEKSAVYRIHPDLTVDTLWTSKEDNAYDIALGANGSVLIGADNQGRVYELDAARKAKLVADSRESEVLRLLATPGGALIATGTQGRLLRLGGATAPAAASGELESAVHDATAIARWGKLAWSAENCAGCRLALRTRSGNSARPDRTWSDWSEPLTDAAGSAVASPNARYAQWKAEFAGSGASASPVLDWVRLAYLPQNAPPSLKSLTVSAQTSSAGSRPAAPAATTPTYSITVTDTGESGASSATGTPVQPLVRASSEQILLSWLAEDPDGDKLGYSVYFRAESQRDWKPLKLNLTESLHTVDAEAFADGRYWFRITVTDRASNPPPNAREDEIVSAPILIDRTPPLVATGTAARAGNGWQGQVEARDALTPLKLCEYSVDGGPWWPLAPADGVIDSPAESFTVRIEALAAGEHVIAVRAYDSANNAGVARFLVN